MTTVSNDLSSFLRIKGYRDTQPRRLVLEALQKFTEPVSPYDIQKRIAKRNGTVSIVTVYRILDLFRELGLVHRHPCSGKLSLCAHLGKKGAHTYLHCHDCGSSQEFCSTELSNVATQQAKNRGFKAAAPLLEISGTCQECTRSTLQ